MRSEKPFWEGKTCKEMAGLHVKVTFRDGSIFTGKTNVDGDIVVNYLTVRLSYGAGDEPFLPIKGIESIELVVDPKYERIDNIENVQVGDIAYTTEGNHFPVIDLKPDSLGDLLLRIRIREIDEEYCIGSDDFAYALRRKPKLPDHDGLWFDKDDGLWWSDSIQMIKIYIPGISEPWAYCPNPHSLVGKESREYLARFAPFRPAKAVEA